MRKLPRKIIVKIGLKQILLKIEINYGKQDILSGLHSWHKLENILENGLDTGKISGYSIIKNKFSPYCILFTLKGVGVDNWALFYTFSSEVSRKPGSQVLASEIIIFFQLRSTTLTEVASTIQRIRYSNLRSKN